MPAMGDPGLAIHREKTPPPSLLCYFCGGWGCGADLQYVFGEIMYGGHITDDLDRVLCAAYLGRGPPSQGAQSVQGLSKGVLGLPTALISFNLSTVYHCSWHAAIVHFPQVWTKLFFKVHDPGAGFNMKRVGVPPPPGGS